MRQVDNSQIINTKGIILQSSKEYSLKKWHAQDIRTLLFYADLVEQAYQPLPTQWEPFEKGPKKKAVLIEAKDNVFAWWQRSIAHLYGHYFLSYVEQLKSIPYKLDSLLFSLSNSSWQMYVQKHHSQKLSDKIAEKIKEYPVDFPIENTSQFIVKLKKHDDDISFLKWSWFFVRLINKKNVLDVVEGEGILKTLHCLNNLLNTLFLPYTYKTSKELDNTLVMLSKDLEKLQKEIFYYLKAVLYTQKPTTLNEAYIKTGKMLINAVQKTIELVNKKRSEQEFIPVKKPSTTVLPFDFTALDKQFDSKKVFI